MNLPIMNVEKKNIYRKKHEIIIKERQQKENMTQDRGMRKITA